MAPEEENVRVLDPNHNVLAGAERQSLPHLSYDKTVKYVGGLCITMGEKLFTSNIIKQVNTGIPVVKAVQNALTVDNRHREKEMAVDVVLAQLERTTSQYERTRAKAVPPKIRQGGSPAHWRSMRFLFLPIWI